jgi:hypothetical protein
MQERSRKGSPQALPPAPPPANARPPRRDRPGWPGTTGAAQGRRPPDDGTWCLFQARRANVESFARDLEARGRARATITRRLCTVARFYRYAVEEELLAHSRALTSADRAWIMSLMPPAVTGTSSAHYRSGRSWPTDREDDVPRQGCPAATPTQTQAVISQSTLVAKTEWVRSRGWTPGGRAQVGERHPEPGDRRTTAQAVSPAISRAESAIWRDIQDRRGDLA